MGHHEVCNAWVSGLLVRCTYMGYNTRTQPHGAWALCIHDRLHHPSPFTTQSHTTYLAHVWPRQPRRNGVKVIAQRRVFATLADIVDVALLHREIVHNARRTEDAGSGAGGSAGVLAGADEADAARDGACDLVGGVVGEERDVVGVVLPVLAVVLVLHLYMCASVVWESVYLPIEGEAVKESRPRLWSWTAYLRVYQPVADPQALHVRTIGTHQSGG